MAVLSGQQKVVRLLIKHHADVNAKDTAGESPLILAAAIDHGNGDGGENRDRLGIAELLLASGADVNAQDNEYASALSLAVNNNSPAMVKLILVRKPKVDAFSTRTAARRCSGRYNSSGRILPRSCWTPVRILMQNIPSPAVRGLV